MLPPFRGMFIEKTCCSMLSRTSIRGSPFLFIWNFSWSHTIKFSVNGSQTYFWSWNYLFLHTVFYFLLRLLLLSFHYHKNKELQKKYSDLLSRSHILLRTVKFTNWIHYERFSQRFLISEKNIFKYSNNILKRSS